MVQGPISPADLCGAHGEVHFKKDVAIKVCHELTMAEQEERCSLWADENLHHYVPRFYRRDKTRLYMQRIRGCTLHQIQGRINERQFCRVAVQLLDLLCQMHQAQVVHGDLQLRNMMLDYGANLFVIDWAVLRPTHTKIEDLDELFPSLYRPPEMLLRRQWESTCQMEWYTAGWCLYQLWWGKLPTHLSSEGSLEKWLRNPQTPNLPKMPPIVRYVIGSMIATQPYLRAYPEVIYHNVVTYARTKKWKEATPKIGGL